MKKESLNIFYVGAFRFPKYDAAAARVLNNAKALIACGHKVEIISWGGHYENANTPLGTEESYYGIKFTITGELDLRGPFLKKVYNRLNRGWRTLELLSSRKHIDMIVSYNPDLVFNCRLRSFTKRKGIIYANDITEWSDQFELRIFERITNAVNLKLVTKRVRNRIVISDYLNRYYYRGNNIVVPPLVDLSEQKWHTCSNNLDESHPLTLIYAGNPAKKDYLHHIVNVCQSLIERGHSIRLLIIGITKEKYVHDYSALLKTTDLDSRIVFMGRISQDDVPAYYMKSDYMVLLREPDRKAMAGFPTKFTEAFASRVPVVANLTSDIGNYLKDGETGFVVDNNSEESLSKTIERLEAVPLSEYKRIRERVREVSKELDYHSYLNRFEHFISHLQ